MSSYSIFKVYPDPVMTAGGELVFVVFRKNFWELRSVSIDYVITAGTAVLNTDYDASLDALSGTLTFNHNEPWKAIRIQTLERTAGSDRTVVCTLTPSNTHRIETATSTGRIQDGTVLFFASSGSSGNPGTKASPKDYGSLESSMSVTPAGDGQGRALFLNRGDDNDPGDTRVAIGRYGGTQDNPMILSAWGTGNDPIQRMQGAGALQFDSNAIFNDGRIIVEDIDFRPSSSGASSRLVFISNGLGGTSARGYTFQRCKFHDPDGYVNDGNRITDTNELSILFNVFADAYGQTLQVTQSDGVEFHGNVFYNGTYNPIDPDPIREWASYLTACENANFTCNLYYDNLQNVKFRRCGVTAAAALLCDSNVFVTRSDTRVNMAMNGDSEEGTPPVAVTPMVGSRITNNVFVGTNGILLADADTNEDLYTGDQVVFEDVEVTDNFFFATGINVVNSPMVVNSFGRHKGVRYRRNTFFSDGIDIRFLLAGESNDGINIADSPFQDFEVSGNIFARINVSTSATFTLIGLNCNPSLYTDFFNNQYYDSAARLVGDDTGEHDTLAEWQTAHPSQDIGSAEQNPVLLPLNSEWPMHPYARDLLALTVVEGTTDLIGASRPVQSNVGARDTAISSPVYVG